MRGPDILARTMSVETRRGAAGAAWQYHSRSDAHSKVACWTLLFDAILECDVLQRDAADGRLGFAINHLMIGPINKNLDLALTRVPPSRKAGGRETFAGLVARYGIQLDAEDKALLDKLPPIELERSEDDAEVVLAVEAKACMTEHAKSLPRLHAEILATGYLAKQCMPQCIVVSYTLVNGAESFRTPGRANSTNRHNQPVDALRVVQMLERAIPLHRNFRDLGYEVVGALTIVCRNDGSPVEISDGAAAPSRTSHIRYEKMIRSVCSEYRARYGR